MKSKIIIIILFTMFTIMPVYSQNSGKNSAKKEQLLKRIAELENQLESIKNKGKTSSHDKYNSICYEKTLYTELPSMSDEQFNNFCTEELSMLKDLPTNVDDHVISSCRQEGNILNASFCVFSNPNAKPVYDEQKQLSEEKERVLTKIGNTKKMYQDMIDALNKEVAANTIEIVDIGGNLALKHLDMKELEIFRPIIEDGKDKGVGKLKEKYGLGNWASTKNEVADVLDKGIAFTEELASVIPGGDKLTYHYLWRIFKSIPEAGKMIGNGSAAITIVFQRREYEQKLKELEKREQELIKK